MAKEDLLAKAALKDQLYGSLLEMTKNPRLYYHGYGREHTYDHWTDEGQSIVSQLVQDHVRKMLVLEDRAIDERARELTLQVLKDSA